MDRIDINRNGAGCHIVWTNTTSAPAVGRLQGRYRQRASSTPTRSPRTRSPGAGVWEWAALDYRTGAESCGSVAGHGGLYNNHYAGIAIGRTRGAESRRSTSAGSAGSWPSATGSGLPRTFRREW